MGRNAGTSIVSFLVGATFGAVIALLYAPTSGEELRGQIRDEADVKWQQASTEWNKALTSMQKSVEDMSTEVKAYINQMSSEDTEEVVEVEVEVEQE
jgi:gas vesicle protein